MEREAALGVGFERARPRPSPVLFRRKRTRKINDGTLSKASPLPLPPPPSLAPSVASTLSFSSQHSDGRLLLRRGRERGERDREGESGLHPHRDVSSLLHKGVPVSLSRRVFSPSFVPLQKKSEVSPRHLMPKLNIALFALLFACSTKIPQANPFSS